MLTPSLMLGALIEILTLAVLASNKLMLAAVPFTLMAGLFEVAKVATTVSILSATASTITGMVIVAVVCPAGMVTVLVTILA
ncbi:hypothetical protein D3C87_716120 [compost metagenome]